MFVSVFSSQEVRRDRDGVCVIQTQAPCSQTSRYEDGSQNGSFPLCVVGQAGRVYCRLPIAIKKRLVDCTIGGGTAVAVFRLAIWKKRVFGPQNRLIYGANTGLRRLWYMFLRKY